MNERQPGSARDTVVTVEDRSEDEVITNYIVFSQYFGNMAHTHEIGNFSVVLKKIGKKYMQFYI